MALVDINGRRSLQYNSSKFGKFTLISLAVYER